MVAPWIEREREVSVASEKLAESAAVLAYTGRLMMHAPSVTLIEPASSRKIGSNSPKRGAIHSSIVLGSTHQKNQSCARLKFPHAKSNVATWAPDRRATPFRQCRRDCDEQLDGHAASGRVTLAAHSGLVKPVRTHAQGAEAVWHQAVRIKQAVRLTG